MEQNRNRFAPEALADESASPINANAGASARSESSATVAQRRERPADGSAAPSPIDGTGQWSGDASSDPARNVNDNNATSGIAFDPVPLRYRHDGLTPEKQREYVEALADCGVAREAAARVGVSEQAINRVRRRADARSFDLACEAAARFSARQIRSIAFERAIEGTIRRHYYHGELKSEEVVYDNRLLIYLLGKLDRLLEPPREAEKVAANWEAWMEAVERGLPEPPAAEAGDSSEALLDGSEVWQREDGSWWTDFPPPAGFDGLDEGRAGSENYGRTLSEAELASVEARHAEDTADRAAAAARRDLYFGFEGGVREAEVFSPREAETLKLPPERGEQRSSKPVAQRRERPDGLRERSKATGPTSRDSGPVTAFPPT